MKTNIQNGKIMMHMVGSNLHGFEIFSYETTINLGK